MSKGHKRVISEVGVAWGYNFEIWRGLMIWTNLVILG